MAEGKGGSDRFGLESGSVVGGGTLVSVFKEFDCPEAGGGLILKNSLRVFVEVEGGAECCR